MESPPHGPEPCASAYSAISATVVLYYESGTIEIGWEYFFYAQNEKI